MAVKGKTISTAKPKTTRSGPKIGRPKGSKAGGKKPLRVRKTKPGRGAKNLINAVNTLVGDQSGKIAQSLIDKTQTGNGPSSRLLAELVNASTPPPSDHNPGIAALNLPDPEALAAEPEWVDPDLGSVWVGDHWENPETAPEALTRARAVREMSDRLNPHLAHNDKPPASD